MHPSSPAASECEEVSQFRYESVPNGDHHEVTKDTEEEMFGSVLVVSYLVLSG